MDVWESKEQMLSIEWNLFIAGKVGEFSPINIHLLILFNQPDVVSSCYLPV